MRVCDLWERALMQICEILKELNPIVVWCSTWKASVRTICMKTVESGVPV